LVLFPNRHREANREADVPCRDLSGGFHGYEWLLRGDVRTATGRLQTSFEVRVGSAQYLEQDSRA
jgi:hypothetical protein